MTNIQIGKLVSKDLAGCLDSLVNGTLPRFLASPDTRLSSGKEVLVTISLLYRCTDKRKLELFSSSYLVKESKNKEG